jgi:hypothetical protein
MRFTSINFKTKVESKIEANLKSNLFKQNFVAFERNSTLKLVQNKEPIIQRFLYILGPNADVLIFGSTLHIQNWRMTFDL